MPFGLFQSPQDRASMRLIVAKTIGRQLQQVFDDDLRRPLDKHLADCLKRMDEQEGRDSEIREEASR
jgi:hypothetical protein